ncbi:hypothetical protein AAG747_22350 [Rapidithrix thailandica]|uniref:Uncharacterized protein n=1 Tax=Rapidithrix thailandica TaxID=413964 RepID=A0AAW9SDX0_9BACT
MIDFFRKLFPQTTTFRQLIPHHEPGTPQQGSHLQMLPLFNQQLKQHSSTQAVTNTEAFTSTTKKQAQRNSLSQAEAFHTSLQHGQVSDFVNKINSNKEQAQLIEWDTRFEVGKPNVQLFEDLDTLRQQFNPCLPFQAGGAFFLNTLLIGLEWYTFPHQWQEDWKNLFQNYYGILALSYYKVLKKHPHQSAQNRTIPQAANTLSLTTQPLPSSPCQLDRAFEAIKLKLQFQKAEKNYRYFQATSGEYTGWLIMDRETPLYFSLRLQSKATTQFLESCIKL